MSARGILVALGAVTVALDAYAIRRLFMSPFYETRQRWAQAAIVLCAPLAGAWMILYMAREKVPMFQKSPLDHTANFDLSAGDFGHHD